MADRYSTRPCAVAAVARRRHLCVQSLERIRRTPPRLQSCPKPRKGGAKAARPDKSSAITLLSALTAWPAALISFHFSLDPPSAPRPLSAEMRAKPAVCLGCFFPLGDTTGMLLAPHPPACSGNASMHHAPIRQFIPTCRQAQHCKPKSSRQALWNPINIFNLTQVEYI